MLSPGIHSSQHAIAQAGHFSPGLPQGPRECATGLGEFFQEQSYNPNMIAQNVHTGRQQATMKMRAPASDRNIYGHFTPMQATTLNHMGLANLQHGNTRTHGHTHPKLLPLCKVPNICAHCKRAVPGFQFRRVRRLASTSWQGMTLIAISCPAPHGHNWHNSVRKLSQRRQTAQ